MKSHCYVRLFVPPGSGCKGLLPPVVKARPSRDSLRVELFHDLTPHRLLDPPPGSASIRRYWLSSEKKHFWLILSRKEDNLEPTTCATHMHDVEADPRCWSLPVHQARHKNGPVKSHQADSLLSRGPRHRRSLRSFHEVERGGCHQRSACSHSELGRGWTLRVVETVLSPQKVAVLNRAHLASFDGTLFPHCVPHLAQSMKTARRVDGARMASFGNHAHCARHADPSDDIHQKLSLIRALPATRGRPVFDLLLVRDAAEGPHDERECSSSTRVGARVLLHNLAHPESVFPETDDLPPGSGHWPLQRSVLQ